MACASRLRAALILCCSARAAAWVLYSGIPDNADTASFRMREYYFQPPSKSAYQGPWGLWHNVSTYNLDHAVLRWGLPEDPFKVDSEGNGRGLGRGITWAVHPDFCDEMLPLFPEENFNLKLYSFWRVKSIFLGCSDLRSAIGAAVRTWSDNHPLLNFVDVSEACAEEGALSDDGKSCAAAEVFIRPDVSDEASLDLAAYVVNSLRRADLEEMPWTTAGQELDPGVGLTRSDMRISTDICWYLDNTFCYNFHRWRDDGIDTMLMIRLIFAGVYVVAGLTMLWILANLLSAFCCPTQTMLQRGESDLESSNKKYLCGGPRCDSILRYAAEMPVAGLLFSLFWLIFMPIFYWRVFLPCWDCYDFQATVAHEFGHVLGFDHPDVVDWLNLRAMSAAEDPLVPGDTTTRLEMDNVTCRDPLMHVVHEPLEKGTDTIMNSVTTHRDQACLTRDDVEGLNFLYPACAGALVEPACEESKRQSGWLRLAMAVGFPFIFATFLVVCVQGCVRIHQKRQLKKLERAVHMLRNDRAALRRSLMTMPSRSRAHLQQSSSNLFSGLGHALDDLMHGRLPTPREGSSSRRRAPGGPPAEPSGSEQRAPPRAVGSSCASCGVPIHVEVTDMKRSSPSPKPPVYRDPHASPGPGQSRTHL